MKATFVCKVVVVSILCLPVAAISQESYRFHQMWPAQQLSWTFLIPNGMAFDKQGNLYVADSKTHRIVKLTRDGFYITSWGSRCDLMNGDDDCVDPDGSGKLDVGDGQFNVPLGVAIDNEGSVYVTEQENHRIQKFDSEGNFIEKWGKVGSDEGDFNMPNGIIVDEDGNIYVADVENNRVQKFDVKDGRWVTLIKDLKKPYDVALDSSEHLYIADTYNSRILKYNPNGGYEEVKNESPCLFSFPIDIDIDGKDNIYIAGDNNTIWKLDADENCVPQFGESVTEVGQFSSLNSMAIDKSGYFYAADKNSIQKFTTDGTFIIRWSNAGKGPGEFDTPVGVAVDTTGYVYAVDKENLRIQKFTPNGEYVEWGEWNGAQQFGNLWGIATDGENNVFVVDHHNKCFKKFTPEGECFKTPEGECFKWGEEVFESPAAIAVDMNGYVL